MERTTFGMTFYIRRTKLDKTGKAPVFLRITMNGLRADTSIKYHISPQLWNTAKGRALENSREGKEVNRMLEAIGFNIMQVRRQLESEGVAVSAQSILSRYLGKDAPQRHTLMEVFREHNEKCRALSGIDFAPTTVQRYESLFRITEEFLRTKYGQDDFYLDDLPEQLVEDYEFYMKTDRRCAHNTVMKNLKNFKKIIRIAMTNGWLKNDPFREKHIHMEQVERAFLEKHEFLHVLEKQIDIPRIRQVRDIFCFCCLTGLAFTDVQQLKPEHIVKDINGMDWIRKARQKTRNMCNIPLLDAARKILERYKDNPYCQAHGVLLPVCSNQKMNAYLKELADICGIRKHLSTHCARHTFATLTLASGATIENVAKMLGHANTNMTRHYARILDSSIMRDMQSVAKSMAI